MHESTSAFRSARPEDRRWPRGAGALAAAAGIVLAAAMPASAAPAGHGSSSGAATLHQTSSRFLDPTRGPAITLDRAPAGLRAAAGETLGSDVGLDGSAGRTIRPPGDVKAENQFGLSLAVSGHTALIGAPTANGGFGVGTGAVYVFVKGQDGWTEQARLVPTDPGQGDLFGASVAIQGDTAVIGAQNKGQGFGGVGAAYVFVRSGATWTQQTELAPTCVLCGATGDFFGWAVAISGHTILVSAPGMLGGQGAVFDFLQTGDTWTQESILTSTDGAGEDNFGNALSLAGGTAVIGAPRGFGGGRPGAAYVFLNKGAGFVQEQELQPTASQPGDLFGSSVAIAGQTVLVGAPGCCGTTGQQFKGAVDVYTLQGDLFTQTAVLTASDGVGGPFDGDEFGSKVALSGNIALIGAEFHSQQTGESYEFRRSGPTWTEKAKFTDAQGAINDNFGHAVAIADHTALIGSPHHDDARGQVSLYHLH